MLLPCCLSARRGGVPPCRVFFGKDPHVSQGAIIANKRLGAVLAQIQADRQERDRQRMASPKLTLRQQERLGILYGTAFR